MTEITNPQTGDTLHYNSPQAKALQEALKDGAPISAIETETITIEQINAGDQISLRGRAKSTLDDFFTIRSIRDGMQTGMGFRTTDGEYVKLPFGHFVTRIVR